MKFNEFLKLISFSFVSFPFSTNISLKYPCYLNSNYDRLIHPCFSFSAFSTSLPHTFLSLHITQTNTNVRADHTTNQPIIFTLGTHHINPIPQSEKRTNISATTPWVKPEGHRNPFTVSNLYFPFDLSSAHTDRAILFPVKLNPVPDLHID